MPSYLLIQCDLGRFCFTNPPYHSGLSFNRASCARAGGGGIYGRDGGCPDLRKIANKNLPRTLGHIPDLYRAEQHRSLTGAGHAREPDPLAFQHVAFWGALQSA